MRRIILIAVALTLSACASLSSEKKERAELHMRIGTGSFEAGDYPAALRELLEANRLDPDNAVVHNNLGLTYFMREKYDLAEKSLRRAIDLRPDYSDARNNLARVLIDLGRYPEAEAELRTVLADLTYGGIGRAWTNMGLSRFNQKDWKGAREAFRKAVADLRDDCVANTYLGRAHFELGDYSKAVDSLDRAVGFCQRQNYDEPHYFSALAWYRLGDRKRSLARFEEVSKLYPDGKYREKARAMVDLINKGVQ